MIHIQTIENRRQNVFSCKKWFSIFRPKMEKNTLNCKAVEIDMIYPAHWFVIQLWKESYHFLINREFFFKSILPSRPGWPEDLVINYCLEIFFLSQNVKQKLIWFLKCYGMHRNSPHSFSILQLSHINIEAKT